MTQRAPQQMIDEQMLAGILARNPQLADALIKKALTEDPQLARDFAHTGQGQEILSGDSRVISSSAMRADPALRGQREAAPARLVDLQKAAQWDPNAPPGRYSSESKKIHGDQVGAVAEIDYLHARPMTLYVQVDPVELSAGFGTFAPPTSPFQGFQPIGPDTLNSLVPAARLVVGANAVSFQPLVNLTIGTLNKIPLAAGNARIEVRLLPKFYPLTQFAADSFSYLGAGNDSAFFNLPPANVSSVVLGAGNPLLALDANFAGFITNGTLTNDQAAKATRKFMGWVRGGAAGVFSRCPVAWNASGVTLFSTPQAPVVGFPSTVATPLLFRIICWSGKVIDNLSPNTFPPIVMPQDARFIEVFSPIATVIDRTYFELTFYLSI
jgi:hypothetical protein